MFVEWAIRELLKCLIWLSCFTSSTLEETPWMLISGFWNTIENPIWELFLSCRQKGNYTSYSHHLCRGSVFNLLLRVESTTLVMHFSKNKYFFPFFPSQVLGPYSNAICILVLDMLCAIQRVQDYSYYEAAFYSIRKSSSRSIHGVFINIYSALKSASSARF